MHTYRIPEVHGNRFTPADSLIPRRERQNTVRGYICSAQAAGNRSWKSRKKCQGCLAHRSPSVKRELIARQSNVQCVLEDRLV